jgi:hypothetical protein
MPRPSATLRIGDAAPAFSLTDAPSGETIDLAGLSRERDGVLLVFHRGFW